MAEPVYVLTRNGRRADSKIYNTKEKVEQSFHSLVHSCRQFDDKTNNQIKIVKTSTPYLIR